MLEVTGFINGKVYSMESEGDILEAFAVRDAKFIATGSNEDIKNLNCDTLIDLKGKPVLPGLSDTHLHILAYGKSLQNVYLRDCRSIAEVLDLLKERAKITPPGQWIRGIAFNQEYFKEGRFPNRDELDSVTTEHPILISRACLHAHVANSPALKLAGIDRNFKPLIENTMIVDKDGEPTGVLWETAATPVMYAMPDSVASFEAKLDVVETVCKDLAANGITSAHPIQGKYVDAEEFIDVYQELDNTNRLPVRIYVSFDEYPPWGMRTGFGNEKIRYGFYKVYMDGSLGSRSAALSEPYSDMPEEMGVFNHSQEKIDELIGHAHELGLQVGVHCIGDSAVERAVIAIEKALAANPAKDPRFRLIHTIVVRQDLIERMQKLPVLMDIQPMFASANVRWSEERLGKERSTYAYAWKRLIDAGFKLTGGSDAPVDTYNPFYGLYALVARKGLDGYPEGGWYPENRVSVFEALRMYTSNAAYSSFEEDIKGTITTGKLADFIVVDQDPFEIAPDDLKDINVLQTWLGGEKVYGE